jgi:hypothetical protein
MFGLVAIMGIPFTSAASGWDGLAFGTAPGLSPFFIVGLFCLWIGYWRHSFASRSTLEGLERWILLVYPLGLILIVLVEFMIGLVGWPGSRTLGMWWVSLPGSVLSAFVFVRWTQVRRKRQVEEAQDTPRRQHYRDRSERVLNTLTRVLRLQWMYRLMSTLFALCEQLIKQLTLILEGDGGVLWAILLMTLIISVLGGVSK